MDNIPICTDCIHCSEYNENLACFRKQPRIDPVDGSEIFSQPKNCKMERSEMLWAWWACGKKAKFFVHKDSFQQIEGPPEDMVPPENIPNDALENESMQAS